MRVVLLCLALIFGTHELWAAEPSWTGNWNTRWRDGGARMELRQQGDSVTGEYPSYGGRIEGKTDQRTLTGRWIEGPRSGGFVFVLAPDGRSFMGRFDNGEWWTGGRVAAGEGTTPINQSGARQALRTFVLAGNAARAGAVDDWAVAAAVMDFGAAADAMAPGQKLAAARNLFDALDLTTFQLWAIPGRRAQGDRLDLTLQQSGTDASLPLTLRRHGDQGWFVVMPDDDTLAGARRALLKRIGGRPPPTDDYKRRRSPRDVIRTFVGGFYDWDGTGRREVLASLDLSSYSDAIRGSEGDLAAQYLNEILDRIGSVVPQQIPDDPDSRQPYLLFGHPSGQVVLAPTGTVEAPEWKFSTDTVHSARDLYAAMEDMPTVEGSTIPDHPSVYFNIRRWIRGHAPALFARVGDLEAWQAIGMAAILAASFAVACGAGWLVQVALRRAVGGKQIRAERAFRWPLRLALTFAGYKLLVPFLGLPEQTGQFSTGITGVLLAASVMWGGWELITMFGNRITTRTARTSSAFDDIVISLLLVAMKVVLLAGGLMFIAGELSLPYDGLIAGLGIGGLALAFASKETLSNVFGAGILVADRPFRRGDYIVAESVEGTVEHVGIRSTRIRTAADSLVVVPNGKLSDSTVNNLGTRRTRLINARMLVGYETSPAELDGFMSGLAEVATQVPRALPSRTVVTVSKLSPAGIEVELACTVDDRSGVDEVRCRNALMMGVLRLAERLRIRLGEPPSVIPDERPAIPAAA